jgi:dienelactone hydrolase
MTTPLARRCASSFAFVCAAACTGSAGTDPVDTGADVAVDSGADLGAGDALGDPDAADAAETDPGADAADSPDGSDDAVDYASPGPWNVGLHTFELPATDTTRALTVSVWVPSLSERGTVPAPDAFDAATSPAATYAALLDDAPAGCPTGTTDVALDGPPQDEGIWPLVVFSHCHECTRFSSFSIAAHLASHGIAVAAADHPANTLFDAQEGSTSPLNGDTLALRVADVGAVLDALLRSGPGVPDPLRGRFDDDAVGLLGHSFGAVTVSRRAGLDDRVRAVAAMGAPPESPLFADVVLDDIRVPLMLVVLTEDNSITEIGNTLLRDNFAAANPPVWKLEIVDAGHWSVSDLCGLVPAFLPGCGADERQTNPRETFEYIDVADGIAIAAEWVTRFFAGSLGRDPGAAQAVSAPIDDGRIRVDARLE